MALALGLAAVAWWPARGLPVALVAGLLVTFGPAARPVVPELVMLDVGQGDALLLRHRGRAVLVDGGGWLGADFGGRVLLPALAAQGVRRLDAVVMTHPDRDHCGGLVEIADYLPVQQVWTGPGWEREGCAGELLAVPGPTHRLLATGDRLQAGAWRLQVLAAGGGEDASTNDRSLVLAAEAAGRRVLLTGDISREVEARLVRSQAGSLDADVLKVAHHGSKSSSSASFLVAAAPRLALISAGLHNRYHHPAEEVLERLRRHRLVVVRTDLHGRVRVRLAPGRPLALDWPGGAAQHNPLH
jgi:competence protein ComEC